jgi:hypothetical protein
MQPQSQMQIQTQTNIFHPLLLIPLLSQLPPRSQTVLHTRQLLVSPAAIALAIVANGLSASLTVCSSSTALGVCWSTITHKKPVKKYIFHFH